MDADVKRKQLAAALNRVAHGDRPALRLVYDMTSAKLFGACLRILNDRSEAEDVLQEVYLTVWNKAAGFDEARASPITWLVAIARNRAIDRARLIPPGATLKTVEGADLTFEMKDGAIWVWDAKGDAAKITIKNVLQSNGVIHVIDTVLLRS